MIMIVISLLSPTKSDLSKDNSVYFMIYFPLKRIDTRELNLTIKKAKAET